LGYRIFLLKCKNSIAGSKNNYRVLTRNTSTQLISITENFNLKWEIKF
jgi:hypothetical protein